MELIVTSGGIVRSVYSEEIDLAVLGRPQIRRASHVEPTAEGRWSADLAPVAGPRLGPFRSRREALAAEADWLTQHWLPHVG